VRRPDTEKITGSKTQVDVVVFHHEMTKYSLYEIPPPNYNLDPIMCREKLL